jgi:pSer/pThr/pTyr-binding forkhead associated (FHA) protein
VVVDEGSTNGTRVRGEKLPPGRPKPIAPGDVVDVGGFHVTLTPKPVVTATGVENTAALARQIVQEAFGGDTEAPVPALRVLNGPASGRRLSVPEPPARVVLGRGEDVDLVLPDEDLSREHAEVAADLRGVLLRDLESKNGTFVGEKRVRTHRLHDGDEIRLGKTVLLFEDEADRRLQAICDAPDAPVELPLAEPESIVTPVPVGSASAADTAKTEKPLPTPASRKKKESIGADVFIYVLAGAVLALSIAGLVILLRAS